MQEAGDTRIHITGPAGSGKSYAATKLSEVLTIRRYDLDDIFWSRIDNSYNIKAEPTERDAVLHQIVETSSWVIEGVYTSWVTESLVRAHRIVVLEVDAWTCTYRILKRFVMRRLGIAKSKKMETLRGLFSLLEWNRDYIKNRLPQIRKAMDEYQGKAIFARSADLAVSLLLEVWNPLDRSQKAEA
jgi:adenylate kinase family enzyme